MKVTCRICKDEAEVGDCARIIIMDEQYYVHDECGLDAIEDARIKKEKQRREDPAELSDSDFLLDLSNKLMHIPPALVGTSQYHAERCAEIARNIKSTRTKLLEITHNLQVAVDAMKQGED